MNMKEPEEFDNAHLTGQMEVTLAKERIAQRPGTEYTVVVDRKVSTNEVVLILPSDAPYQVNEEVTVIVKRKP